MKFIIKLFLYGVVIVIGVIVWYKVFLTPCNRVIKYDIGAFDERFDISKDTFIVHIERAELAWEEIAGKQLFRYVPGSSFKVNLIFSEEQQRLYERNKLDNILDNHEVSIDTLQSNYKSILIRYQNTVADYEKQLEKYEQEVSYWNKKGGVPEEKYQFLKKEEYTLDSKASLIETLLTEVNHLAEENNKTVENYNNKVSDYNNLFAINHEFDAGNTDGTEINIYSYDGESELQTLLVHEFGHVLGIDHVDDSHSVMYYLLNEKNKDGRLSDIDKKALELVCRL